MKTLDPIAIKPEVPNASLDIEEHLTAQNHQLEGGEQLVWDENHSQARKEPTL